MSQKKIKKEYLNYLKRWEIVNKFEEQEVRDASSDLLFKQTLSMWDIGSSLDFSEDVTPFNSEWSTLQKAWIRSNAGE